MFQPEIEFGKKNFSKTTSIPKKFKKMTNYSFFSKFFIGYG